MSTLKQEAMSGVLWSAIERFSVQGIQFILSFIIARQLLPSDYGLIAMLSIFMAIAQCFVDSGFSNALIQKQNRNNVDYSTAFYFNIVVGVLMYLLLIVISPYIALFYNQPILKIVIFWTGLSLIINSIGAIQKTILIISLDFKRQAYISLISVLVSGVVAVYMAFNEYGVWTLVVQSLLNNFINTFLLWFISKWHPLLVFSTSSFKELFSFGSKLLTGGLLHTIYTNLYTLVIGKFFPVKELGLYSRASSLSQYPSINITGILDRVLYPILCKFQNDNKELTTKFYMFLRLSAFCIFPFMVGLAVLAEPLIKLILTDKWIGAVPYVQILCIAYMWEPIMRMSWNLLNVKHRSDYSLMSEILKKITALIILVVTIPLGIKAMCWGMFLYSFCDLIIILQFVKKILPGVNMKNHIINLLPIIINSLLMGLIVILSIYSIDDEWCKLGGGFLIGLFSYILLTLINGKKDLFYIFNLMIKH